MRLNFPLFLAVVLVTAGCATPPPARPVARQMPGPGVPTARAAYVDTSYWKGDETTGSPEVVINLSEQRAYFYKGKKVVGESRISSGRKQFETPPGSYKVIQKDKDHRSNLYGRYLDGEGNVVRKDADVTKDPLPEGAYFVGAPMPYFVRFHGGYGFHSGMVPHYRASHGCVRLPHAMARHFFEASEVGMPVTVKN